MVQTSPVGRVALSLVALVLGGCSMLPLDKLIFFPDRDVPDPPPGVDERWITTEDGLRIHAWYVGAAEGAPTLVWSHGNGGNIAGRVGVLRALGASGLNVLAYDYRGYGRSEGRPSEAGVYRDVLAAYDSVRASGVPPERIVGFGESLGGAVSVYLATQRPCASLAVVSTFTSMDAVARVHYGALGVLAGKRFDSLARIGSVRVPMLVAHGDRDEIVPFALGEELFQAAHEPKHFFRAGGFFHNDVFAAPGLIDAIAAFAHQTARAGGPATDGPT